MPSTYKITCHCTQASQQITSPAPSSPLARPTLCHCPQCRKTTGVLSASYAPIAPPAHTTGLVAYQSGRHAERLFCGTCGCHIFLRCWKPPGSDGSSSWAVATGVIEGVIVGDADDGADDADAAAAAADDDDSAAATLVATPDDKEAGHRVAPGNVETTHPRVVAPRHINAASTRDGGLAKFLPLLPTADNPPITARAPWEQDHFSPADDDDDDAPAGKAEEGEEEGEGEGDSLTASCHCRAVTLHITRPNAASALPRRGYTDLMFPFCSTAPAVAANPGDEKWWLRPPPPPPPPPAAAAAAAAARNSLQGQQQQQQQPTTRYLAGTCACRSCRLISGFEIQTWAFVPRANIFLHSSRSPLSSPSSSARRPLDFAAPASRLLPFCSYPSGPGVVRDFCGTCGATLFWRNAADPSVVDVSAGLFDARRGERGGSRAEEWLDWFRGRVSFAEEAGTGRWGVVKAEAEALVECLERGLRGEGAGGKA